MIFLFLLLFGLKSYLCYTRKRGERYRNGSGGGGGSGGHRVATSAAAVVIDKELWYFETTVLEGVKNTLWQGSGWRSRSRSAIRSATAATTAAVENKNINWTQTVVNRQWLVSYTGDKMTIGKLKWQREENCHITWPRGNFSCQTFTHISVNNCNLECMSVCIFKIWRHKTKKNQSYNRTRQK